jgi:hypothetical protein|tara:strand:- start:7031 stop:7210 length:180 start_codon:yes stop_codon:yes gene_type:complete
MLFQLYGLRSIPTLPETLKTWLHGRITWMEVHSDAEDLSRLQDMVSKKPGDGYPIGDER